MPFKIMKIIELLTAYKKSSAQITKYQYFKAPIDVLFSVFSLHWMQVWGFIHLKSFSWVTRKCNTTFLISTQWVKFHHFRFRRVIELIFGFYEMIYIYCIVNILLSFQRSLATSGALCEKDIEIPASGPEVIVCCGFPACKLCNMH